jgi:glycosyltransferase involved in cell wall biosynthesis
VTRIAFVIPARNKAPYIAQTLRATFAQTYSPMDIVISDQGSTDGTREIIHDLASGYNGPNVIRLLDCPDLDKWGMPGLNAHLNWIHGQIDADFIVQSSADDIPSPERTARTVAAWRETGASYISTRQVYMDAKGEVEGYSNFGEEDQFVDLTTHLNEFVGGSCSSAWEMALWHQFGPLPDLAVQDVMMPFWAFLDRGDRGYYFIADPLHGYVKRGDVNNTGLQQRMDAAEGDELVQVRELAAYQLCAQWSLMQRQFDEFLTDNPQHPDYEFYVNHLQTVYHQCIFRLHSWVDLRSDMTLRGIQPLRLMEEPNEGTKARTKH